MTQPIDAYFINASVQLLIALLIMLAAAIILRHFGSWGLLVMFEGLVLTIVMRRMDELGQYWGIDIIPTWLDKFIISWVLLALISGALLEIYVRRTTIQSLTAHFSDQLSEQRRLMEQQEAARIEQAHLKAEQAERLAQFEARMRPFELRMWNGSDALAADHARSLNTEIETANALNAPDVTQGGAQVVYKVESHG